jgi:hypothetical protein
MRVFAVAALAGQLQSLPGALACVNEHRRSSEPSHCDEAAHAAMPVTGTAGSGLTAAPDGASGRLCGVLGPCAVTTPGLTQHGFAVPGIGEIRVASWPAPPAPASVDIPPQPPPPVA